MIYDHAQRCWVHECAPGADLDYGFDWAARGWLEPGETIVESSWVASPVVTLSRQQVLADIVTSTYAKIDRAGYTGTLTNTITTSEGRIDSRIIKLVCR